MNYAVIMAGGTGKRLWPLSRKARPKQILKLIDGETLLTKCFKRLVPLFDPKNILVLTNSQYVDLVREELGELPNENVIAEPAVRDTTGAIGLAAAILSKRDIDSTMAVVTADHIIEPVDVFQKVISDAITFVNANPETLITFGVAPTFASTQLGYIKCVEPKNFSSCKNQIYTVEAFKEKPDEAAANEYIKDGRYFWNSGMFVWKTATIFEHLKKFVMDGEPLTSKVFLMSGSSKYRK